MKPKFTVKLTPRFSRDIKALDRNEQVKILRQVHVLETEPHAGKPLHGEFAGAYSLRIGNFRALYRIEGNQVFLLTVGHRKKIYRGTC